MEGKWTWVVMLLRLTLLRGCCHDTHSQTGGRHYGPNSCQIKCELVSRCDHFDFDSSALKCVLYRNTGSGYEKIAEITNDREESTETEQIVNTASSGNEDRITATAEECQRLESEHRLTCLTAHRNKWRCVKPAALSVSRPENEIYDCGQCTSPGQRKTNYKLCRCPLGCSKKVIGQKATCHRRCERYGSSFTMTRDVGIRGINMLTHIGIISNCNRKCVMANFLCLSYEHRRIGFQHTCHFQAKSWLDVEEAIRSSNDTGWEFYHRDCL